MSTSAGGSPAGWRGRSTAALVGVIALAGLIFAYRETRPEVRDRRAIREHLDEMERGLRRHDASMWLHVTTRHEAPESDPLHRATHDRMLRDFERLQHLASFAMKDVRIEVTGDQAVARYRIETASPEAGAPRPPVAGELRMARGDKAWEMIDHRLIEAR
jgi:hypothetical protein